MKKTFCFLTVLLGLLTLRAEPGLAFKAGTAEQAKVWQVEGRQKLANLLWGESKPALMEPKAEVLRRIDMPSGGYVLEELLLQTLPDRKVKVWMASPKNGAKAGAVLALHGHGGRGEEIVRGLSLYWYGRAFAEMGYVVISPDIGQHDLHHPKGTLMGERVWDALRCVDYLQTRSEVDTNRIAVAGLSLGGETAMYVAALDERIKAACSSGWLTTVENMKKGHCPCWNFPGLEQTFDFSDIFALVAPRPLVLELGERERAPGGFPVDIGRTAFAEISKAYAACNAADKVTLTIHPAGHVFNGRDFWYPLKEALGTPWPWQEEASENLRRGEMARRLFSRALNLLDGWWKTRDTKTSLFPRRTDQPVWAPHDNAADMLPFLLATAHCLAPERLPEILESLRSEQKLTSRLGALPDLYSLTNNAFVYAEVDLPRLIFSAAEYCKDGLAPMTELMGSGPWIGRMRELLDAIIAQAPVQSSFGLLPSNDIEVNGDLLQALARFFCVTKERKYLEFAERIGDAYCFEVLPGNGGLPPHRWDFKSHKPLTDTLNLNDHGNELIGGLAELFVVTLEHNPERARRYKEPIARMFHRLLEKARNEDALWVNLVKASTGEVMNKETPDTWGYALAAMHTFGTAAGEDPLIKAVRSGLQNIRKGRYLDWNGADSYADSIEGALLLLNRIPDPNAFRWLEDVLPIFLGKQREDGIVEGWYGDGNYARTALMAGLYFTQGAICQPWGPGLTFGATQKEGKLRIELQSTGDWEGRVLLDTPRHRVHMGLPVNYARLNEFPEWFTVETNRTYNLVLNGARKNLTGAELAKGVPLRLRSGETQTVLVERSASE